MKSTLREPIARFAFGLVAFVLFMGPILHDFRLMHIADKVPVIFFYITFPLQTFAFIALVVFRKDVAKWRMDWMEMFIIFVSVWVLLITALYMGDVQDLVGNFFRLFLVYFCYRVGRDILTKEPEESVWKVQNMMGRWGVWGVAIADIFLYAGVLLHRGAYLGLVTEASFVGFAVMLAGNHRHRTRFLWLFAILIILGGKRGNMLAMVAMLLVYAFFIVKQGRLSVKLVRNLTFGFAGMFLFASAILISGSSDAMAQFIPKPLADRFAVLTASSDEGGSVDVASATSGRNFEVEAVLAQWRANPTAMWTGQGLGANITETTGDVASTVHISPLAMSHIFGVPVGLGLYLAAWWFAMELFFFSRPRIAPRTDVVWALVAVSLLTTSLSVFNIIQTPLIWISVGALAGRRRFLPEPAHTLTPARNM